MVTVALSGRLGPDNVKTFMVSVALSNETSILCYPTGLKHLNIFAGTVLQAVTEGG